MTGETTAASVRFRLRHFHSAVCRHRIIDNRQHVRTVVSIGQGLRDQSGEIAELRGFFIDVTRSLQRDLATRTHEAVQRSAQARAGIEQAKGALMAIYSIDEEEAFAILTWHSQNTNTKLRDVAETLTASLDDPDLAELASRGEAQRDLGKCGGFQRGTDSDAGMTASGAAHHRAGCDTPCRGSAGAALDRPSSRELPGSAGPNSRQGNGVAAHWP